MKDKSPQEQAAAARQVELISNALENASGQGHWLNAAGHYSPRLHEQKTTVSPFNRLILGLHTDSRGFSTPLYTTFTDVRRRGEAVLKDERSVPMNWYRWDSYVNRHDDRDVITRDAYQALDSERQKLYKGVRKREIRPLFNLEQTTFQYADTAAMERLRQQYGSHNDRGNIAQEERNLRSTVAQMRRQLNENLIPIRKSTTGEAYYDPTKDAVYMPDQKHYAQYGDYVQDMLRQVVAATGHRERQAREGASRSGQSADSSRYELLVNELASGVKMLELGLPAKLSPEAMRQREYWAKELKDNPRLIDAIEADVNNALDLVAKAERCEKVQLQSESNRQQTEELRDRQRPQVSSAEALVLLDIMAHGGMEITPPQAERAAFLEKFSLGEYATQLEYSLNQARQSTDSEVIETAYTEAANTAAKVYEVVSEMYPREWELKGSRTIAPEVAAFADRRAKEFVVVRDPETHFADVILPGTARSGGDVVMPNGTKHNFWLTPDEVMSEEERKEAGAQVVGHAIPGMNRDKIAAALKMEGAVHVRFFSNDGLLGYRPDDRYFAGKECSVCKLEGTNLRNVSHIDTAEAVKLATETLFDRIQMVRDDNDKWALLLKPDGEPSYCIYPDRVDLNRFFTVAKNEGAQTVEEVRNELAQKYHALAKANPELKRDLFGAMPEGVDTERIERVNIFKGKDGRYLCVAKINGEPPLQPREVSRSQWQRLWAADDVEQYKTALAAKLFADALRTKEQTKQTFEEEKTEEQPKQTTEEQSVEQEEQPTEQEEQHEEEAKEERREAAAATALAVNAVLFKQFQEMKAKHPDALLLFRTGDFYEAYQEDAQKVAKLLDLNVVQHTDPQGHNVDTVGFPSHALDGYLEKLVLAKNRVAICEQLEQPRQKQAEPAVAEDETAYRGLRR